MNKSLLISGERDVVTALLAELFHSLMQGYIEDESGKKEPSANHEEESTLALANELIRLALAKCPAIVSLTVQLDLTSQGIISSMTVWHNGQSVILFTYHMHIDGLTIKDLIELFHSKQNRG